MHGPLMVQPLQHRPHRLVLVLLRCLVQVEGEERGLVEGGGVGGGGSVGVRVGEGRGEGGGW